MQRRKQIGRRRSGVRPESVRLIKARDELAEETEREFTRIRVVDKIVSILDLFTVDQPELEFTEIRGATRMPNSTCARLLLNLVHYGVLTRSKNRYRVGLSVLRWAAPAHSGLGVAALAAPVIARLRDATGETVGLFVRAGHHRLCVELAETRHVVGHRLYVGHVLPLHIGSSGKVLLAFDSRAQAEFGKRKLESYTSRTITSRDELRAVLDRVRLQGYAISIGEWDSELNGVAVPIFDHRGEVIAAIGLSAPALRLSPTRARQCLAQMRRAAADISAWLGRANAMPRNADGGARASVRS